MILQVASARPWLGKAILALRHNHLDDALQKETMPILLTWFPGIDWSNGVLSALTSITDPYLNIFRGIIPPIGGFDISSLLAFLLLNVIQNLITNLQYASLGYS